MLVDGRDAIYRISSPVQTTFVKSEMLTHIRRPVFTVFVLGHGTVSMIAIISCSHPLRSHIEL